MAGDSEGGGKTAQRPRKAGRGPLVSFVHTLGSDWNRRLKCRVRPRLGSSAWWGTGLQRKRLGTRPAAPEPYLVPSGTC